MRNFAHQGWAGFILHEQWKKVKQAVKAWHSSTQAKMKENEKLLLSKLESLEATADLVGLNVVEVCIRSAIKAEILSIYQFEERNLIQKSKLNWLSVGDENTEFFHRFLNAKKRKISSQK